MNIRPNFLALLTSIGLCLSAPASLFAQDSGITQNDAADTIAGDAVLENADQLTSNKAEGPAVVQNYDPTPAIWKLSDEDTTIYLFGTIHVLPRGFRWRSPELDAIIEKADELVVETYTPEGEDDGMAEMAEIFSQSEGRGNLSDLLLPANREKFKALATKMGFSIDYVERLPAWMMSIMIQFHMSEEMGSYGDYGVETELEATFLAAGKPIGSIEDGMTVFRSMSAVGDEQMIGQIDAVLSAWDGKSALTTSYDEYINFEELNGPQSFDYYSDDHAWARGDAERMANGMSPEDMGQAFYKALLFDRNANWVVWLEDRLKRPGVVLLAVGAGHLAGPDSVQAMLEERGLKAERIH